MRTSALCALLALSVPAVVHAACPAATLTEAGFCKGPRRSNQAETVHATPGSDIARDPYAYTRARRTDHGPLVRRVFAGITGVEPANTIERYYTMRMDGGWTETKLAYDIRRRYGQRSGTVEVGALKKRDDATAPDHDHHDEHE